MKRQNTLAVVLKRIEYGEADRIVTVLTPDFGKVHLMVKGARRQKSKLAEGIELLSVSEITFIVGKGELRQLVSGRLIKHYASIVRDIDKTMYAYEVLKLINRTTEDEADSEYYDLLVTTLEALNNDDIDLNLVRVWFSLHLLQLAGHSPNLTTDNNGKKLEPGNSYGFEISDMQFQGNGSYSTNHIKLLRLCISFDSPESLQKVAKISDLLVDCAYITTNMLNFYIPTDNH